MRSIFLTSRDRRSAEPQFSGETWTETWGQGNLGETWGQERVKKLAGAGEEECVDCAHEQRLSSISSIGVD